MADRRTDPLAALFANLRPLGAWVAEAACADLRPLGAWVAEAACADLPDELASVFTEDKPDPDALDVAEAVCWRCEVRTECADYAAGGPVWGLWAADWHDGTSAQRKAA